MSRGFSEIAALSDRYRDDLHHSLGTLTQSGEYALPNYRAFERVLKQQIKTGLGKNYDVSLRVKPSAFTSGVNRITDILYAEIWAGPSHARIYRYKIDCDIQKRGGL